LCLPYPSCLLVRLHDDKRCNDYKNRNLRCVSTTNVIFFSPNSLFLFPRHPLNPPYPPPTATPLVALHQSVPVRRRAVAPTPTRVVAESHPRCRRLLPALHEALGRRRGRARLRRPPVLGWRDLQDGGQSGRVRQRALAGCYIHPREPQPSLHPAGLLLLCAALSQIRRRVPRRWG
jgi:hypothetical protein